MGDEIATVMLEKEPSPDDPLCKTYSQIKAEALKSVIGDAKESEKQAEEKQVEKANPKLSKDTMKEIRRDALKEKLDGEASDGAGTVGGNIHQDED